MAAEHTAPMVPSAIAVRASVAKEERTAGVPRRHRRRSRSATHSRTLLLTITSLILGVLVVGAPLAVGAVHRPAVLTALCLSAALALLTAALAFRSQAELRPLSAMAFPILFVLIAALQIVPIPSDLRARIDRTGSELLELAHLPGHQPLSLDPPATYLHLGEAAASLAVTAAALVLAATRRRRFTAAGLVAVSGLATLVIGVGHRAIFEDKIYGLFPASRGLPVGPFINPNHTAEFLELAAFAALAFAFTRASRLGQHVWKILAAVLAAGALSTISRGSILALASGALVWFLLAPKSEEGEPLHRTHFAATFLGLVLVVGIALGFGARGLLDRLLEHARDGEVRFRVWGDVLSILRSHPFGIGLGGFARVYPSYQSFPSEAWFQFPENQPLNILAEAGLLGALLMLAAWAVVIRHVAKRARRDRVEASLIAGLIAVLAHNLTDFGLETLGVLLPFSAVWGTLFGRMAEHPEIPTRERSTSVIAGIAGIALVAGVVLLCLPPSRDFDALLRLPSSGDIRTLVHQASQAHPTDHTYALNEARLARPDPAAPGNRLRLINRAIILCPKCGDAHVEAARELWRLRRHSQALLEWRTALTLPSSALANVFAELCDAGATEAELTSLANESNREELSRLLLGRGMVAPAREVMAGSASRDTVEFHLVQAQIALGANDLSGARAAAAAALASAPRDPRVFVMAAELDARENKRDEAIATLTRGLQVEPSNIELNQHLLGLLVQTDRWRAVDQALEGLRRALFEHGSSMFSANVAAAQIFERRGQYHRAVTEYQAALAQHPEDVGLRLGLARTAEEAGSITVAVDAYSAVLRQTPSQPDAKAGLAKIQGQKRALELSRTLPSDPKAGDK